MMVISLTQRFFLCTETGSESVDIREEKGMFGLVAAALLELEQVESIEIAGTVYALS